MQLYDLIFAAPKGAFEPVEGHPEIFRKEVIYPGHFVKKTGDKVEFEFSVDETMIDHWAATFQKMKANGVDVPVPVEHTTDPLARQGTVVDLKKEFNASQNRQSLYAYVQFKDAEAAKLAKTTNVSLFSPPKFTDGLNHTYVRPIKHLALTDYPVIPGLAPFEKALAASHVLVDSDLEDVQMSQLSALADDLGIEYEEGATDEEIHALILDAWDADEDDTEMSFSEEEEVIPMDDDEEEELEDEDEELEEEEDDEEVSASLVARDIRAREAILDGLVTSLKITPVAARQLKERFCKTGAVALSLSRGLDDGFDSVVEALSMNAPRGSTRERTGTQDAIEGAESRPMVKDAEQRAKRN